MLTICRASAGSGKTHKLTGEYLKLLYETPMAYKRILAVTFTNKATDEMKSRIIEELYNISSGKSSDYLADLSLLYRMDENEVRCKANELLIRILHDYSSFNISTIDRFFQQIMRSFARELGLQGGYGIEMDKDLVLNEAIDKLLMSLEDPQNNDLLKWLLRFAEERIENGGSWNIRDDIKDLSKELFKESYQVSKKGILNTLNNKQILNLFKEALMRILREKEKALRECGEKAINIMNSLGLTPSSFIQASRSPFYVFEKLSRGEIVIDSKKLEKIQGNVETWYARKTSQEQISVIESAYNNGLKECVDEYIALSTNSSKYYTAKELLRYFYTLGILNDVSIKIDEYEKEANVRFIGDTNELLNKLIKGDNSPFVYEKIGTHIDHYMIDEFQDTSSMQWNNFRPLLEESLSAGKETGNDNLIVGDVKQSIYRFRNSDWNLLDSQVKQDFSNRSIREENLEYNWRSCRDVIRFNNSFFKESSRLLQKQYNENLKDSNLLGIDLEMQEEKIKHVYNDSVQQIPNASKNKPGHVRIEFFKKKEQLSDWKEEAQIRLVETVKDLQQRGYKAGDIAVLVRYKNEGVDVANIFLEYKKNNPDSKYKFDVISEEALKLGSVSSVRFLIALFRFLKNPENKTNEQIACFNYAIMKNGTDASSFVTDAFSKDLRQLLIETVSHMSLYEMTETLFSIFKSEIDEREHIYVLALLDMIAEFSDPNGSDLENFLNWWDEKGKDQSIVTPDGQDAIRIITIHKSKGLGFKAVIIPYADWAIDHSSKNLPILWSHSDNEPFNLIEKVPVKYTSSLSRTDFVFDYFNEKNHVYIDNLNILYVAFTRAKEVLTIFAPVSDSTKSETKISRISDLLWNVCNSSSFSENVKEPDLYFDIVGNFDKEHLLFDSKEWCKNEQKASQKIVNEIKFEKIETADFRDRLHLRLKGKDFISGDRQRVFGNVMHEILSKIRTISDMPDVVESYYRGGTINESEKEELKKYLWKVLSEPISKEWFDENIEVLNEVDILAPGFLRRRPDRIILKDQKVIIVDYKFGMKEQKKHRHQLKEYIKLIHEMGFKSVEAYLWYVELNKIEAVKM